MQRQKPAFTLVELLVVVAIIVVLLAMMVPALARAVYQAEVAVCGAQLKGVATGSVSYAMNNRRYYFHRAAVRETGIGYYEPRHLNIPFNAYQTKNTSGYDDRPQMSPYIQIKSLQCPPAGKVSLEESGTDSYIFASYALWVGWKYDLPGQNSAAPIPSTGMYKLGDKLGYDGKKYSVLAGDNSSAGLFALASAHPDGLNKLSVISAQATATTGGAVGGQNDNNKTYSHWFTANLADIPGMFDMNFAWDDASVRRLDQMDWNSGEGDWFGTYINPEPRTESVPAHKDANYSGWGVLAIPKGQ